MLSSPTPPCARAAYFVSAHNCVALPNKVLASRAHNYACFFCQARHVGTVGSLDLWERSTRPHKLLLGAALPWRALRTNALTRAPGHLTPW